MTRYVIYHILLTYLISNELVLHFFGNVIFYNMVLSPTDLTTSHHDASWVHGDFYMERLTYVRCHRTHKFLPNCNSTLETDRKEMRDEKMKGNERWGSELEGRGSCRLQFTTRLEQAKFFFFLMKRKESCAWRALEEKEKERKMGEWLGGVKPFSKVL